MPAGLVCAACNQYFGTKIERYALDCFPLNLLRVMQAVPTRKGRPSKLGTTAGVLSMGAEPGRVVLDPTAQLPPVALMGARRLYISTIPAYPRELCRLLVKTGLELLACESVEEVRTPRFHAARMVARQPVRGSCWSYAVALRKLEFEVAEAQHPVCMELTELEGCKFFVLRFYSIVLLTPLEPHQTSPSLGEASPEVMIHAVEF